MGLTPQLLSRIAFTCGLTRDDNVSMKQWFLHSLMVCAVRLCYSFDLSGKSLQHSPMYPDVSCIPLGDLCGAMRPTFPLEGRRPPSSRHVMLPASLMLLTSLSLLCHDDPPLGLIATNVVFSYIYKKIIYVLCPSLNW